jgi:uncharacterized lipoprotein YbaY
MLPTALTHYSLIWFKVTQPLVTGEISIPADAALPAEAVAYVRLLDTTLADAPSITVAEVQLMGVALQIKQGKSINFVLVGEKPNLHASYTVSVHIDTDNSGQISIGDYITMQAYPVLTYGHPHHVVVEVKQVL